MAEHPGWGVPFSQYSEHRFEPRTPKVSEQEAELFYNTYEAPHFTVLEKKLHEFCSGGKTPSSTDTEAIISILGGYITVTKRGKYSLLNYYYGFLCLRFLIYYTCCAVLAEKGTLLGDNHKFSQPSGSWNSQLKTTAFAALDRAGRATQERASLTALRVTFTRSTFLSGPGAREIFCSVISAALWEDRNMFLTLCLRGLLPGCSLLLFATMARIKLDLFVPNADISYLYLQDLGFRLYLAGSHRDRQVLEPVCMAGIKNSFYWPKDSNRFVDSEDSQAVSQAYLGFLFVWQENGWSTKSLPIDFMAHLIMFISHMSESNPSATFHEHVETAKATFRFLWSIFEDRGRIPVSDHFKIREFALPAFSHLCHTQDNISTRQEQRELAQMLAEIDFVGLVGRVLLLISDEGNEFQNTERFKQLLDGVYALGDVISKSASTSPELFIDSKIEWGKVFLQLGEWRAWDHLNLNWRDPNYESQISAKDGEIMRHIVQTFTAWTHFGDSLSSNDTGIPQNCANPRCIQPITRERRLRVRYMCEKCHLVAYCGQNCQRAHWELKSLESHKLQCDKSATLRSRKR
ncbi:hypothetical protein FRC12_015944 [Ceratobasidium sp. 428]|nr:hypothetical protein FRC12_015944 [Ceratobasidium sp. 428]